MITTEQVKELRDKTSVSVMQCRKALEEAGGDMEKALILLQKKGSEIAEKKSDREAADGIVVIKQDDARALVLTLNCETDFVAHNDDFITLAHKLLETAWANGADAAREQAPALISDVVLKIGENIQLGLIEEITGGTIGTYTHHTGKNACVVVLKGGDAEVAKNIAMHTAAMKPLYLSADQVDDHARAQALDIIQKEVGDSDKPEEIKAKMLEGKIASFFKEQTLLDQPFFKSPDQTIAQYAKAHGAEVVSYKLFIIG
ncbi:MAG: translation elongation factor Ts [bacterium]